MFKTIILKRLAFVLPLLILIAIPLQAQDKSKAKKKAGKPVMWESVEIAERDLFYGPGGTEMLPDLSKITFIKEEKSGHNKKYRIRDGSGRVWVAKLGREAKPETAAVRLLWALGYKTEINYLVPKITIPGKGTFEDVRLEARPDEFDRLDEWKWMDNPFVGTNELQGLKIMMVFFKNWDVLDLQNKVVAVKGDNGLEHHYIISDLGATFGSLGNNNLPIFYRLGRSTGNAEDYQQSILIREVENGEVELSYKGKSREVFENIHVKDVRWLYSLISQLSDKQIADAFRAANYPPDEVKTFTEAVKSKIAELKAVATGNFEDGNSTAES
ncbi:MAG: hypothetical protein KIS76_18530 [Pyrinomonadaceae bacterium]|nr:hypothetical protein [Pyrinomonadaceae bacterium]